MHSGSRKHILDWVERVEFTSELTALLRPTGAVVSAADRWMPRGWSDDTEARLSHHGEALLPGSIDWSELRRWWLVHNGRANTPNWDLASSCDIAGRKGLVLVEAKAHVEELSDEPKHQKKDTENKLSRSQANHDRIGAAIEEASTALSAVATGVALSRDSHYQLSNRVAFAWKLASSGIETVLLYLGFTGDSKHGTAIRDGEHWNSVFCEHASDVLPGELLEREVRLGSAAFRILVRAMPAGTQGAV
jgi:hypothetical protein